MGTCFSPYTNPLDHASRRKLFDSQSDTKMELSESWKFRIMG